jgi:hypothetical protein
MSFNKSTWTWIVAIVAVLACVFIFAPQIQNGAPEVSPAGPKNATYVIGGKEVTLVDGRSEQEIVPGSATKTITTMFGEPVYGDMDADGDEDAGVLLVQDPGGSGTFYYAAVALNDGATYTGTSAVLLGDRIAPQTSGIARFIFTVNYAERAPGESMTARTSVGVSKFLTFTGEALIEANKKDDLIESHLPNPGSVITSPLFVTGRARGNWFFEASFPLILVDWDGRIIAQSHATAEGEWMTSDYVPFRGTLTFQKPAYGERGTLILKKDNPSGLPEFDNALEVPVFFE